MPEYVGYVQAPNAFAAVECLMRFSGLHSVAYACARALDGSLIYRGYRVRLEVEDEECSQVV